MEREKQKAVERERQAILCKRELEARKKLKEQARDALGPDASKFVSKHFMYQNRHVQDKKRSTYLTRVAECLPPF